MTRNDGPGATLRWLTAFLLMSCAVQPARSQLEKLFISGTLTDAATGAPIIGGTMTILDSLDKNYTFMARSSATGEIGAALYSGAHYAIFFEAEGYMPRCAVIDLKGDRDWPDVSLVWEMTMPVQLERAEGPAARPAGCEWRCVYRSRTAKLDWLQPAARERFPITVAKNKLSAEELEMEFRNTDNRYLLVKGQVKDLASDRPIQGATVRFSSEGSRDSLTTTDGRGTYEMKMPFDKVFRVTYTAEGKVGKIVEIDPRTVPEKVRKQGFVSWTDITLFDPVPGADLSFLDQPIGKAAYNAKSGTLEWDMEYSRPIMERLNAILEGQ